MYRELLLLGLLRQNDTHGYRLHEFINRDLAYCTDLTKPTAYRLLQKMASDGWIEAVVEQEGNRPPRHTYRVTPLGETRYAELLKQNLAEHIPARFADDIGLAFVETLPSTEAIALLQQRRERIARELNSIQEAKANASHAQGGFSLVILHQSRHISAELAWIDEVIAHLETEKPK